MKINIKPYNEDLTIHITEASPYVDVQEYGSLVNTFYQKMHDKFKTSLKAFKTVVGKQSTVKTYSNRNWIWTFTSDDDLATVYCLVSKEGVAWEYDKKSRKNKVLPLLKEIVELF